ncbi:MAG: hypothetical protein ACREX3_20315, partial [Gammaproteobacteria bacterium]
MKARASDSDVACLSAGRSRRKELVAARPSAFRGQDGRNVQTRAAAQTKGHASPLNYALFRAAGAITDAELMTFRKLGSRLEGHPTPVLP